MGDGMTFDVEQSSDRHLTLRSRIERLIEIHQEKKQRMSGATWHH